MSVQNSVPLSGIAGKLDAAIAQGAFTLVNAGGAMGNAYSMSAAEIDKFSVRLLLLFRFHFVIFADLFLHI